MTDNSFERCILLIRQGDKSGLKEIYDGYGKLIYSVMLSAVKRHTDAEDLTSDFFLKLWDKLADTYKAGNGHKRWLVTAARNMAVDFLRKNSRMELTIDRSDDNDDTQKNEPVSSDNTEDEAIGSLSVREALSHLDDKEREIVNLKLFADLTFREIAPIMAMPLGTVTWKYRNAIKKLQKYVKEVQE